MKTTQFAAFYLSGILLMAFSLFTACQEEDEFEPAPEQFEFTDFQTNYGLNLLGSAALVSEKNGSKDAVLIRLARSNSSGTNQLGGCWYGRSKMAVADGFESSFSFRFSEGQRDSSQTSFYGFAFVIQNAGMDKLGSADEDSAALAMGFDGLANCIAIGFYTFGESGGVYVVSQGKEPNFPDYNNPQLKETYGYLIAKSNPVKDLTIGTIYEARIVYQSGSLTVYLDDEEVLKIPDEDPQTPDPDVVALSELLNLDKDRAYVGFTAATRNTNQNQDILSWSFKPTQAE